RSWLNRNRWNDRRLSHRYLPYSGNLLCRRAALRRSKSRTGTARKTAGRQIDAWRWTHQFAEIVKPSVVMRSDIVSGALFPDYELTDHTGKRWKLSELQGQDPMILVLSRGSFCPKDRRQHEGLVQLHRELEV